MPRLIIPVFIHAFWRIGGPSLLLTFASAEVASYDESQVTLAKNLKFIVKGLLIT